MEPDPTKPLHSPLYIEGISVEQMIGYFNEVVLSMEYTSGSGDASLVQKWDRRIYYRVTGEPTAKDLQILQELFDGLNKIEGFFGIQAATGLEENLSIQFLNKANFEKNFASGIGYETADGAALFWYYNATNGIYTGRVGYRTDISQTVRDSVVLEEIVNVLGINDTTKRRDSITYQYASDAYQLSDVDWVILKLLYHPAMKCGMNAAQCEEVIRNLYY